MPRWPNKDSEVEATEIKDVKEIKGLVPFTTKKALPKCISRVNKQGETKFVKYGEARYFLKRCDGGFKFIKIFMKTTSSVTRLVKTYKTKNIEHKRQVKKFREAGIPVIGD